MAYVNSNDAYTPPAVEAAVTYGQSNGVGYEANYTGLL